MPTFKWTPTFKKGDTVSYDGRTAFEQAEAFMRGRQSRVIGSNTRLVRDTNDTISVYHHRTPIVSYEDNGEIVVDTGGYHSMSTKVRVNEFSPLHVWQKDHQWYYSLGDEETGEFEDGLAIKPKRSRPKKVRSLRDLAR